jgi:hypothetical protein
VNYEFNPTISYGNVGLVRELEIEPKIASYERKLEHSKMFKDLLSSDLLPSTYLKSIKSHIPSDFISNDNYEEIYNLASYFDGSITSFFGFESKLDSLEGKSDYLIAVSSQKKEREELLKLVKNKKLDKRLLNQKEWQNIGDFTENWIDPNSILNDNVLGMWLEFDTSIKTEIPIPSIFLHTTSLRIDKEEDIEHCLWATRKAIPLITGKAVPKNIEDFYIKTLGMLPERASVFHIASMISRNTEGIRLVIKRIKPDEIVPFLKSIGWKDKGDCLSCLIKKVKKYSNCIRLHINITDQIDDQIGLECFISPDKYHEGKNWDSFLDFLVQNGMCLPHLKNALLDLPGVEQEDPNHIFNFQSYLPSVKINDNNFSKAIVRYISHIKITYKPNSQIKAKAYSGIRLFGKKD